MIASENGQTRPPLSPYNYSIDGGAKCGRMLLKVVVMETSVRGEIVMDSGTFAEKRQFVDAPSGRVGYVEQGRGPVAVFLHGVLLNGYLWRHQLAGLADLRRCIAPDL